MILVHAEAAGKRMLGIDEFEWFSWESINGGIVLEGGIPYLDGSGKKKWDTSAAKKVFVSEADARAEYNRYEQETGKCGDCFGKGQVLASWHHINGTTLAECRKCGGSGDAKELEVAP